MTKGPFLETITVLPVHDIAAAADWYGRVLGMRTVYLHEGEHPGEATNYATVERDGVPVHLILDEPPPHDTSWTKAGTGYLYLKVRDVDALFGEVIAAGAVVDRGLQEENWGPRGFNLRDASGNAVHVEQS